MKTSISYSLVLFFITALSSFPQNYEISISMNTLNDSVFLTHIMAREDPLYRDTVIVLKNGKGVFRGSKVLPKGLYSIVSNGRKFFDILIGDSQKFEIEVDTTDILKSIRFISSPDNDVFYNFMRSDIQRAQKAQQLNEQYKNATDDMEKKAIGEQWQALDLEKKALLKKLIEENGGLYVSKFLKTLLPLELPKPPLDAQGRVTDSTFMYRWYRAHVFDNFNIYDPDLLRTPLYEKQIVDYMTWFSRNHPVDTICAETDRILTKVVDNKEVFRCILATMFNHFTKSDLMIRENVWVNLVDKWYVPHTDWANIDEMKKAADKERPTLIGKVAPPMDELLILSPEHFRVAALDTAIKNDIHAGTIMPDFRKNIKSKYLAILFWDVNCSHCKERIQQLWNVYEACKGKGLQVIAVQTWRSKEGKIKWIDFINEHNMYDWTNAWIIYDQKWQELYDAAIVPLIYLLNEKKEIILKEAMPDQIQSFIEAMTAIK